MTTRYTFPTADGPKCRECGTQVLTVADPGRVCRQCVLEARLTSRKGNKK